MTRNLFNKRYLLIASSLVVLAACGTKNEEVEEVSSEEITEIVQEPEVEKVERKEPIGKPEEAVEEESIPVQTDSAFQWIIDELAGKSFMFSAGVGAWGTSFTFEEDGRFSGAYYDADATERVESEFTGQFIVQEELDEYTYHLTLEDFEITSETGKEEIKWNLPTTYVDSAHGFQEGSYDFELYLPFKPKSEVTDMYLSWVYGQANNGYDFLNTFGLYNLAHEFGMEEIVD